MIHKESQQAGVAEWFNKTYATRGERYLRPAKAYLVFLELLKVKPGQQLLDVACGMGRLLEAAKTYECNLTGIDISKIAVDKAREKVPEASLHVGNAECLPFNDGQFEIVTCIGSLERFLEVKNALHEMHRVGSAQASYCVLVRNANTAIWKYVYEGLNLRNKQGHQDAKTLQQWNALFTDNGFEVVEVIPDQYPLQKRKKWLSLGLKSIDYRAVIPSRLPLACANEFIFMLRKS